MKAEVRIAGANIMTDLLKSTLGDKIVPIRVSKTDCWAVDLGLVDEETGKPIYGIIKTSIPNTKDTATTTAFDLTAAVQARIDYENEPKKEKREKKVDPEAAAKKAAREAQEQELEKWLLTNLDGEMTATEILNTAPCLKGSNPLQTGTYLKNIVNRNPSIQKDVVKGKGYFSRV